MKFEIVEAENGFIVTSDDGETIEQMVYQDTEDEMTQAEEFRDFLYEIIDHFGPSRSNSHYVHVEVRSGNELDDYQEQ